MESSLTPVDKIPIISDDRSSSDVMDDNEYSPILFGGESSRSYANSDLLRTTAWTSNISINSGSFEPIRGDSCISSIGMSNVGKNKLSRFSSNSNFFRHKKSNDVSGDDLLYGSDDQLIEINTNYQPHPHFQLYQRRLNKFVLNIEHLSLIYRRKLHKNNGSP